jgi:hypothetical protein
MELAPLGYEFAEENPITHFMTNKKKGKLRDDILNEKATSAIVEGKCKLENLPVVLEAVKRAAQKISSVFTVEVITKVPREGKITIKPILDSLGYWYSVNTKNNMGLGEPAFKFHDDE